MLLAYQVGCLFLISLQSFYVSSLGAAVFCYLGAFALIPLMRSHIPLSSIYFVAAYLACLVGGVAVNGLENAKTLLGSIAGLSALFITYSAFSLRPEQFAKALRWVILLHVAVIAGQMVYWFATGTYFDVLQYTGLGEQTVISRKGFEYGGSLVPRFAGMFNEPGTYSAIIAALLAAEFAISRRISWLTALALASILGTMSLAGMALAALFVGIVSAHRLLILRKNIVIALVLGVPAGFAMLYWFLSNLGYRDQIYTQGTMHGEILDWATSYRAMSVFGLDYYDIPAFYSLGYLGVWLDFLIVNGVAGFAAVLALWASMGFWGILLGGVVMATKIKATYPLLFTLFAAIQIGRDYNASREANAERIARNGRNRRSRPRRR